MQQTSPYSAGAVWSSGAGHSALPWQELVVTCYDHPTCDLAGMALALTKSIAKRNRNVSVQDCYLGLDFAGTAMGARLLGDYIAVQIPENLKRVWYWDDWIYEPRTGLIVLRADPNALIPYNYVVFGVSRFDGD